ncbi:hypothetical protein LEP1GSC008_2541 [Leptospira kirschneri serovar Bulgarica str. Nikolaevo]|uniref:Uncharacterized protein n=2 Tax=Leptospira kirschneri TaxID=29507 RepID=A0A0E2BFP9_9LEPT|nr:hypothetical protein LEP1GSC081_3642 [Leptospira kirschneri str. H1]EMK21178.1 hypothetical protein LEP1GSC008_2541 [Leptospira kirschneri serovar Bulgarica str. Nikolaevo]
MPCSRFLFGSEFLGNAKRTIFQSNFYIKSPFCDLYKNEKAFL